MISYNEYIIYQVYAIIYKRLMVWDVKDSLYVAYQIHGNICEINYIKCIWYMELSQVFPVWLNYGLYIKSIQHMIYKRCNKENLVKCERY